MFPMQGNNQPPDDKLYVDDVFSTYLYTGNGSTQTINNGIDLAGKGGMVWAKMRNLSGANHVISDTARGTNKQVYPNSPLAEDTVTNGLTAFNSNGFTLSNSSVWNDNSSSQTYASWTFRKQPKFFDIVTYTGNGATGRNISHNLGSVPGCIIVRRYDTNAGWDVYHQSLGATKAINLHSTGAAFTDTIWNSTSPTSTVFTVSGSANTSSGTYVAYLFAHNAGGFGLSGTDNVISCGSYTGNGSATGPTVTLGYEPQWLLIKSASGAVEWVLNDNMRGIATGGTDAMLHPNFTDAEYQQQVVDLTSTGFVPMVNQSGTNASGSTYIYIAIRRGPMKVPTSGTEVYQGYTYTGDGTNSKIFSGLNFPADLAMWLPRNKNPITFNAFNDRLRGFGTRLETNTTAAEATSTAQIQAVNNTNFQLGAASGSSGYNFSGLTVVIEFLRRAPGFFDEVCYTGTGATYQTVSHNLGAIPELVIVKSRNDPNNWTVMCANYNSYLGKGLYLNHAVVYPDDTAFFQSSASKPNNAPPTATTLYLYGGSNTGSANIPYVAYLFASCPGVSKVGSYTGTGTTQQINCGFTTGARFVLIKRTDSTGDWYVWDSARGIVSANDPRLSLNSTAAEVTTDDSIDPNSSGFIVNQVAATNINVNAARYIFLAIA